MGVDRANCEALYKGDLKPFSDAILSTTDFDAKRKVVEDLLKCSEGKTGKQREEVFDSAQYFVAQCLHAKDSGCGEIYPSLNDLVCKASGRADNPYFRSPVLKLNPQAGGYYLGGANLGLVGFRTWTLEPKKGHYQLEGSLFGLGLHFSVGYLFDIKRNFVVGPEVGSDFGGGFLSNNIRYWISEDSKNNVNIRYLLYVKIHGGGVFGWNVSRDVALQGLLGYGYDLFGFLDTNGSFRTPDSLHHNIYIGARVFGISERFEPLTMSVKFQKYLPFSCPSGDNSVCMPWSFFLEIGAYGRF